MSERKTRKKPENGGSQSTSASPMDVSLLERIVKLMAANDLNTVDVRDGERRVILKRGAPQAAAVAGYVPPHVHMAPSAAGSQPGAPGTAGATTPADADAGLTAIKSPMVGTFYSKPSPDAKAFVTIGSPVTEDTDVCIIEAMKTFNTIQAGCRGTIARVLIQDGQTVDVNKVLFLVRPS